MSPRMRSSAAQRTCCVHPRPPRRAAARAVCRATAGGGVSSGHAPRRTPPPRAGHRPAHCAKVKAGTASTCCCRPHAPPPAPAPVDPVARLPQHGAGRRVCSLLPQPCSAPQLVSRRLAGGFSSRSRGPPAAQAQAQRTCRWVWPFCLGMPALARDERWKGRNTKRPSARAAMVEPAAGGRRAHGFARAHVLQAPKGAGRARALAACDARMCSCIGRRVKAAEPLLPPLAPEASIRSFHAGRKQLSAIAGRMHASGRQR